VQKNALDGKTHPKDLVHGEPPQDMASSTKEYIDEALSTAMQAMRAAIHSTMESSPRSLTFKRDMFLNSLTASGTYMRQLVFRVPLQINKSTNFWPLKTFDS
jgi:hypothetical protein